MRYRVLPVTDFAQNCSLLWCEATRRGAFVDPGGEAARLLDAAAREGVTIEKVLLTHGHVDHVGAAVEIANTLQIPIEGPHKDDAFWLDALVQQSNFYGFPRTEPFTPHCWLGEGDTVRLGDLSLSVIHCPGHTPGHVVFFEPTTRVAFVGDVLFHGSVGRSDFPRGDHATLIRSIREKLLPLGDDITFVPGHGPLSTFGEERRHNPFLTED